MRYWKTFQEGQISQTTSACTAKMCRSTTTTSGALWEEPSSVSSSSIQKSDTRKVCLLVGCLSSQQHASVSQGRICTDNFTCCPTEIEAADQTFYLTQSQYTDTGPTSPSADPITPGAWHTRKDEISFFDNIYSKDGIRPDTAQIQGI